jgi:hypothetical protein
MKSLLTLGATLCLIAGCNAHGVVVMSSLPELPSDWGEYFPGQYENSKCPIVSGVFHAVPEVVTLTHKGYSKQSGDLFSIYGLIPFELANSTLKSISMTPESERTISIVQGPDGRLVVAHVWANGKKLETSTFNQTEFDFDCADGFIEFPRKSYYGQLEGVDVNNQTSVRLRKATDGSLIAIKSSGRFKSADAQKKGNVEQLLYRFRLSRPSEE